MKLTSKQSFIVQQVSSILAQSKRNPSKQQRDLFPSKCLHQPYYFGFQFCKANLSTEKGGKKISLLIHSTALKMN